VAAELAGERLPLEEEATGNKEQATGDEDEARGNREQATGEVEEAITSPEETEESDRRIREQITGEKPPLKNPPKSPQQKTREERESTARVEADRKAQIAAGRVFLKADDEALQQALKGRGQNVTFVLTGRLKADRDGKVYVADVETTVKIGSDTQQSLEHVLQLDVLPGLDKAAAMARKAARKAAAASEKKKPPAKSAGVAAAEDACDRNCYDCPHGCRVPPISQDAMAAQCLCAGRAVAEAMIQRCRSLATLNRVLGEGRGDWRRAAAAKRIRELTENAPAAAAGTRGKGKSK
jgi:hypothetical protein